MAGTSRSRRKAQLDAEEREHLEAVVGEMRDRVEDNVEFQLTQRGLDAEPDAPDSLDEEAQRLVEAIELEATDERDWTAAFEEYVTGVGYTVVNRLAALRCMEVRGLVDEEVTVFKENGLTSAAETLAHEEFLLEDEAILAAYREACDDLAEEIEILFDRSSAYGLLDPDADAFAALCGMLDEVPDAVWRADDVLGWVYEYYNGTLLDDLRRKGDREGLDPEDVPPANQFYTPHWVVRMLTDNSLGKLYLEQTGELEDAVEQQQALSPDERKRRPLSPDGAPDVADCCTYLVPSESDGESTDFDDPADLRVIDPACGSGHFLLYAFDVLERIWWAETDLDRAEIPRKILRHNLYGVDLDVRACQLAAFNLYLKARTRAEAEGADGFDVPEVGIVCADAAVADVAGAADVFAEVADGDPEVEAALGRILDAFEEVHGLGSLLDVRGTLGDLFEDDVDDEAVRPTPGDEPREDLALGQMLRTLREAVDEHRDGNSLSARGLRSFVGLLDVLARDYDVALMNPPYGAKGRMPDAVQRYVEDRYRYGPEYYVNFVEACDRLCAEHGRIGMLVPRSFMFKRSFEEFRRDFQGEIASFDFLAEFGLGVLDNATVRTVGTVLRSGEASQQTGTFIRLDDPESHLKERTFVEEVLGTRQSQVRRLYQLHLSEFGRVPKAPMSYWTPPELRSLFEGGAFVDADVADVEGESTGDVKTGLQTGDNPRFVRNHWEVSFDDPFYPFAKGGSEAWILPKVVKAVRWADDGAEIRRIESSRPQNTEYYFRAGVTWTYIKETGRRFGYFPPGGVFDQKGPMVFPDEVSPWLLQTVLNSELYHGLFLALTPDREWNPGDVGRIPFDPSLGDRDRLEELAKAQYERFALEQRGDPVSPYYVGPPVLPDGARTAFFHEPHPHLDEMDLDPSRVAGGRIAPETPLPDALEVAEERMERRLAEIEALAGEADELLYDHFDVSEETRTAVRTEIELRGSDSSIRVSEQREPVEYCKQLVHHFAMEAVRRAGDGVVPLHATGDRASVFDRVVERFRDAYGEHANDRLAEVDDHLGTETAPDVAYPNVRAFLADDLFDYHVETMENAPILWKLTTGRLVPDPAGEGFACFVDYHRLDAGFFDRLSNRYLEPRKADLRERRAAADRRRSDSSLPATERAEAAETYERCASGLEQVAAFEAVLQDLSDATERPLDDEHRERAGDLAAKVAAFRAETERRLAALDDLRERRTDAWFAETFSPTFWETVAERRGEWLDALADLERACREYAGPADEPVEAHLADLFDYFGRRLKGSAHFSSTGVLFATYYFEREGAAFLGADGEPKDDLPDEDARRLAELAAGLDEYRALADDIEAECEILSRAIPSDWSERALAEVTTAGYRPVPRHGVAVNLVPLAEAEIVPETVGERVI